MKSGQKKHMYKGIIPIVLSLAISLCLGWGTALAKSPEIQVTGPFSVALGESVQLGASTSTGIEEDYLWFRLSTTEDHWPFDVSQNGTVTGKYIGTGVIGVMGESSGAMKSFDFSTLSGKEVTLSLEKNFITDKDHSMHLEIDCRVWNTPPEESELLAAVEFEDALYFFPDLSQQMEVFRESPRNTTYEIINLPIQDVPFSEYTFYAAITNAQREAISNLASQSVSCGNTDDIPNDARFSLQCQDVSVRDSGNGTYTLTAQDSESTLRWTSQATNQTGSIHKEYFIAKVEDIFEQGSMRGHIFYPHPETNGSASFSASIKSLGHGQSMSGLEISGSSQMDPALPSNLESMVLSIEPESQISPPPPSNSACYGRMVRGYCVQPFADLRGVDLSGADLILVDLRGVDLSGADLSDANLSGACLRGADLREACLDDADLSGADLSGADLREACLDDANLSGADLSGTDLRGTDLRGTDLSLVDLSHAILREACLDDANLSGADLSGADLRGTDLRGTDLSLVDLSLADLSRADLSGADINGADLSWADLSGATWYTGTICKEGSIGRCKE